MLKKEYALIPVLLLSVLSFTSCGSEKESVNTPEISVEIEAEEKEYFTDKSDRSDEGYLLIWNDEFEGDALDPEKWCMQHGNGSAYGIENWGNNELQSYEYENVTVENGELIIEAKKEDKNGKQFTSGRLRTMTDENEPLFSLKYGRVEAKIKIEGGSGIWPAFWMLPVDTDIYGTWAASGEIDIMEAMGRLPGKVGGTAHYGGVWPKNVYSSKDYIFKPETDISDYHTYAVEWTPKSIKWYVDDECYETLSNWYAIGSEGSVNYTAPAPFDVPFYIILNLAVGGSFDPQGYVKDDSFPAKMYVDFVRVYQKEEGYDENVNAAYNTALKNETGHFIYNDTFDEGVNRLAFWNTENLDANVPSVETDAEGKESYKRIAHLSLTDPENEGSISQTGLTLKSGYKYGVMFDIGAENETDIEVLVTDKDGLPAVSKEVTVPKTENMGNIKFTFTSEFTEDLDDAVFKIVIKNGGPVTIDNIIYRELGKDE